MNFNETVSFGPRARNIAFGSIGIGLVLIIISAFVYADHPGRIWANFLLSNFFFLAISICALMFLGIKYLSNAGWFTSLNRIAQAMGAYLPVAAASFAVFIIAHFAGLGSLEAVYLWVHPEDAGSEHAQHVLHGKAPYLNVGFWSIRMAIYFIVWWIFYRTFRRWSLKEDEEGGLKYHNRSVRLAAGWVPAFSLTFAFCSYDLLMSVQPLWYSTIFSVNMFAGGLVGAISAIMVIAVLLKQRGHLQYVNESQIHDLGKFMFAFSIFWAYTWLSQYLLIWYANLPEETPFYFDRQRGGWWYLFFTNFFLNFIFPFIFLMMRESKRRMSYMVVIGVLLLVGKYLDWYIIIMPNTAKEATGFGLPEIGFMTFYFGLFVLAVGRAYSKARVYPRNHPYLMESVHHEI